MKTFKKLLMILTAMAIISCGDKKEEKEEIRLGDYNNTETTNEPVTTHVVDDIDADDNSIAEVELTANDQMRFNKQEIQVKAGQKVKLTLKHVGQMDKNVMGHNFVLLKEGTDISEFGNAAASAPDNAYIPQGTNQVIANTPMLGGGEEATIEFEAPAPGTYTFICSFPGHYALMQGTFIVE